MQEKECSSCAKETNQRVNVPRVIATLDAYLEKNDLAAAARTLEYWEGEALRLSDRGALLSILNEELGFYRRSGEKDKALSTVRRVASILDGERHDSPSRATIYINLATTMKACGLAADGLSYYQTAEEILLANGHSDSFTLAALYNNRASALCDLQRFAEAERDLLNAIAILRPRHGKEAEIALSYIGLAQLYAERNGHPSDAVETMLDLTWEYLNTPDLARDGAYAFAISKCAPTYRALGREDEAAALEAVAEEIYQS